MDWTQNQINQYLAQRPDVAAAIDAGTMDSAYGHFTRHGQAEGTAAPADPVYASRYHEIRGVEHPDSLGTVQNMDYSNSAVNSVAHKNPYHYVNSQTGELNRDQLQQEIQSGAFRFNPDYYAAQNPDLAAAGLTSGTDLMNHFLDHGWNEGRNYAIQNPNYTSDISNGFGGTVAGVNGSALPQFQDTLGGWDTAGTGAGGGGATSATYDRNAFDQDAFMQQFQDMFAQQQQQWNDAFSQQQNNYQQYTDQFFNNMWSTQPQAATYFAGNWNDPYQQSAVLPPQYQANNGGPQNGFAPNWQQSNPFAIPTF